MSVARISANGQITIPPDIQEKLDVKPGDRIRFFQKRNGEVVICNASEKTLCRAPKEDEKQDAG